MTELRRAVLTMPTAALRPSLLPLTLEYVDLLLAERHADLALAALRTFPPDVRESGRPRLTEARAALLTGDLTRCSWMLDAGIEIPDIGEGEGLLHELWFDLRIAQRAAEQGRPVDDKLRADTVDVVDVPWHLDFRMR